MLYHIFRKSYLKWCHYLKIEKLASVWENYADLDIVEFLNQEETYFSQHSAEEIEAILNRRNRRIDSTVYKSRVTWSVRRVSKKTNQKTWSISHIKTRCQWNRQCHTVVKDNINILVFSTCTWSYILVAFQWFCLLMSWIWVFAQNALYRPVTIKGRQTSRPEKSAKIIDTSLYMTPWHNENLMYTTCLSMLKDFSWLNKNSWYI